MRQRVASFKPVQTKTKLKRTSGLVLDRCIVLLRCGLDTTLAFKQTKYGFHRTFVSFDGVVCVRVCP